MQRISSFAEIEVEFMQRITPIVYCNAATVDSKGRPRSRVIHPIWEAGIGWFTTEIATAKTEQLAENPFISLAYIAEPLMPAYVECRAVLHNDTATRQHVWELYKRIPEPMGSDLARTWGTLDNPVYGVVRLEPWRVELYDLLHQENRRVWRTDHAPHK